MQGRTTRSAIRPWRAGSTASRVPRRVRDPEWRTSLECTTETQQVVTNNVLLAISIIQISDFLKLFSQIHIFFHRF